VATLNEPIKQTQNEKIAIGRRAGHVRQNGDSTGEGIVSNNIGLSFVYLMCLNFCSFVLFYFCFIHAFLELFHASLVFIFESTHKLLS
jgi:hypothetical protein